MPLPRLKEAFELGKRGSEADQALEEYSGVFYYNRDHDKTRLILPLELCKTQHKTSAMAVKERKICQWGFGVIGVCIESHLTPGHNKREYRDQETNTQFHNLQKVVDENLKAHLARVVTPAYQQLSRPGAVTGLGDPSPKKKKKSPKPKAADRLHEGDRVRAPDGMVGHAIAANQTRSRWHIKESTGEVDLQTVYTTAELEKMVFDCATGMPDGFRALDGCEVSALDGWDVKVLWLDEDTGREWVGGTLQALQTLSSSRQVSEGWLRIHYELLPSEDIFVAIPHEMQSPMAADASSASGFRAFRLDGEMLTPPGEIVLDLKGALEEMHERRRATAAASSREDAQRAARAAASEAAPQRAARAAASEAGAAASEAARPRAACAVASEAGAAASEAGTAASVEGAAASEGADAASEVIDEVIDVVLDVADVSGEDDDGAEVVAIHIVEGTLEKTIDEAEETLDESVVGQVATDGVAARSARTATATTSEVPERRGAAVAGSAAAGSAATGSAAAASTAAASTAAAGAELAAALQQQLIDAPPHPPSVGAAARTGGGQLAQGQHPVNGHAAEVSRDAKRAELSDEGWPADGELALALGGMQPQGQPIPVDVRPRPQPQSRARACVIAPSCAAVVLLVDACVRRGSRSKQRMCCSCGSVGFMNRRSRTRRPFSRTRQPFSS